MKCCLALGKKKASRKPLTELYVEGHFTEDREEWQKELQRHYEEVYTDQEETREVQEKRIECYKKKGDQQFTEDGCNAEITADLVLQARAKLCDNKVNGPEDAVVREMIKILPLDKIYTIARFFQDRFVGQMDAPDTWKIVKLVFLRKPDAEPKKVIRSYRAFALTSVVSKWYASCVMMRTDGESARNLERTSHGRSQQHELSTSTGVGHKSLTKTLEMARGKISHVETWQRDSTNHVYGKLGHQDCLRRGEVEACCKNHGKSQHTWMADRGPLV